MQEARGRILLGAAVAALVAVVGLVLAAASFPFWASLAVAALASGAATALAAPRRTGPAASPVAPVAPAPPVASAPPVADPEETLRALRHDLRGILSPALLTADRLLMTTEDPIARSAAEAMIDAVERAERCLSSASRSPRASGRPQDQTGHASDPP